MTISSFFWIIPGVFAVLLAPAALAAPPEASAPPARAALKTQAAPTSKTLAARPALSEKQKVEWLIQSVQDSGLKFIRNGREYESKKAAEHLRGKWNYALKHVKGAGDKNARDFIRQIATGSSFSGRPYQIVLKDGTRVPSGVWLTKRLEELEKGGKIPARPAPATPAPAGPQGKSK